MDDLKLISLVESNDAVYNKYNPDYKDVEKKKEVWNMISHAMGYSSEDCLKRWTYLRDRFVREKRIDEGNQETGNVSSTEGKFRWPLMEAVEFITPFITPRGKRLYKKLPIMPDTPSTTDIHQDVKYNQQLRVEVQQSLMDPLVAYSPMSETQTQSDEQSPQRDSTPEPEYALPRKRKKEDLTETEKLFTEAVWKFKEICKTREQKAKKAEKDLKNENIALHSFGQMIMATIGSMSHANQAKAMKEVTDIVMRIKMESHTTQLNEFMHQFPTD